ncbi:DUF2079 domain-containing protein [Nostoc sp. MG11]|uniref:DUF2079 domain-containing protein n=1 Tax=Nostoc sp. MG11 TaxID=2721166 RepID=UPI001866C2C3|nr:DUF2079 domain-containing protein [Nostoc sp. MG11]
MKKNLKLGTVGWMIGISALVLFASSSLRHELFQSTAWDLGIFDQAVYLISQGQAPISSFLISAIPCLAINLFADYQPQKELLHRYSLPILPFLLLSLISSLAVGKGLLQHKKAIILWSLVAFVSLAKFTYFGERYLESIDTWQATREASAQVQPLGSVLTTDEIAPHLSHRPLIKLIQSNSSQVNLKIFNYILLNIRHYGLSSNQEFEQNLLNQLKTQLEFKL